MKPAKITLSRPIRTPEGEVSELELREPTLGALEEIEMVIERRAGALALRLDLGHIARLVSGLCDIPLASAKQIPITDLGAVLNPVMGFLGGLPGTGGSSGPTSPPNSDGDRPS